MKQFSAHCSLVPFAPPPGRLVWGEPRETTLVRVLQRSVLRGNDPAKIQAFGGVGASGEAGPAPARRLSAPRVLRPTATRRHPTGRATDRGTGPGPAGVRCFIGGGRHRRRAGGEGACRRGDGPGPARDGPPEKIRWTLNFAIDSPGRLRYKPRHTGRASPLARDDDQSVGRAATQARRLVILKRWAHSSVGRAADS
jgi:hypothetical protein